MEIFNIVANYSSVSAEDLLLENVVVEVSGRIHARRIHRKTSFYNVFWNNSSIQVVILDELNNYQELTENVMVGDIVSVVGQVKRTQKGELSVYAHQMSVLSSCETPMNITHQRSENFSREQRDQEIICNPEMLSVFTDRSMMVQRLRQHLYAGNFLEIETPILHAEACGAQARTFETFCNALDRGFHLRVAPETYLVRALSMGLSQIFEIGKNFRNEGVSGRHQPEFTMLEAYRAFSDWQWAMENVESVIQMLFNNTLPSFKRLYITDVLAQNGFGDIMDSASDISRHLNVPEEPLHLLQYRLFETVEHTLVEPTFVLGHPVEISPLAKRIDGTNMTERFELFVNGIEIANGFSQLINADEQEYRFSNQSGDEVMLADRRYVESMRYGFPPIGGFGIGIDRLFMMMSNNSDIRDVVLFPY